MGGFYNSVFQSGRLGDVAILVMEYVITIIVKRYIIVFKNIIINIANIANIANREEH